MHWNYFIEKYQKSPVEHYRHKVAENVLVSVLVQTYNHERYIKDCLNSILEQKTNFDFEIIIGEDNSTDKTREICIAFANKFPEKIRLFLHKEVNKIKVAGTPTGNFNGFYNFYSSNGRYIAFCEGDDFWNDPLKLQKQVDFLSKNSGFVLCFHKYLFIDALGSILDNSNYPDRHLDDISAMNLKEMKFHLLLSTVCFRKEFNKLPEQAIHVINVDTFILSLLGFHGAGKYLDEIIPCHYRIHNSGIWSKKTKSVKFKNKLITYRLLRDYYKKIGESRLSKSYSRKMKLHLKMALLNNAKTGNLFGFLKMLKFWR